jgi:hypothetical protein
MQLARSTLVVTDGCAGGGTSATSSVIFEGLDAALLRMNHNDDGVALIAGEFKYLALHSPGDLNNYLVRKHGFSTIQY